MSRVKIAVMIAAALAASGCGIFKKAAPKTPTLGERIPVEDLQGAAAVPQLQEAFVEDLSGSESLHIERIETLGPERLAACLQHEARSTPAENGGTQLPSLCRDLPGLPADGRGVGRHIALV